MTLLCALPVDMAAPVRHVSQRAWEAAAAATSTAATVLEVEDGDAGGAQVPGGRLHQVALVRRLPEASVHEHDRRKGRRDIRRQVQVGHLLG